jgi:hypothetical protein
MKFIDDDGKRIKKRQQIEVLIKEFIGTFKPLESDFIVMTDYSTLAYYIEVHISADKLINLSTIDVPLDPDEQVEYRANRDIIEDHDAFIRMKEDARKGRTFSNLVAEFNTEFKEDTPLKIIGGQHRFLAIKEALEEKKLNCAHGVKIYFDLNNDQRLDVQLISNTNIAASSDLLDRMFETIKGPELRNWCQETGLLFTAQDFADKKQRSNQITVRMARSFILSYLEGRRHKKASFDNVNPVPIIAKTGGVDEHWEEIRCKKGIWSDSKLLEAAKQFASLQIKQKEYYETKKKGSLEFATKPLNYSVLSSWAYIAGLLEDNATRLRRHFGLSEIVSTDPLNAAALAKGRHKTDPENYRGLGTRTDKKERGRLSELFYLQAEKGEGINAGMVDVAIKKYHLKLANIEVVEAERKMG